ncbi:hypothetical protein A15D_02226 [Alcanivorax sp. MD8A]|nr:hypothetical protein A15D_02226 [Alcanivorax sp. MD8A]|tara:strand:- start:3270 stop:3845 length:576 start_codon:yes stop_codon:yes gene_type:complete
MLIAMKRFVPLILVSVTALGACQTTPKGPYGYTDNYLAAEASITGSPGCHREAVDRFISLYNPLNEETIKQQVDSVYAESLYFNDTLVTLTDRTTLRQHLIGTASRLDHMSLEVRQVLCSDTNTDVFVLWQMEAIFSVLGRSRLSRTIGISQLRFNRDGLIHFHQDFWDSSQGLDQHLPVLGPPTRWLRDH